ncbi:Protein of unknown function [Pseudobutyrivibrio sp. JW11]|uniref:glycosyltransferase 87 family protein n=1 Tax=Pseudobutyrivibrio sp. JW11 TaxID=1855302 RepID=UPI0008E9360B|nr:glycosyltransferase 87 family protein [Pseudobutyrivibrio sp. JW11]SFO35511.1 Protein of unknown function [Pseudobutyrivibrio sp. JW11]
MIFKFEERILKWMNEHILALAFAAAVILSIAIRYFLRNFYTTDADLCLIPWYNAIKDNGGLLGLGKPVEGLNYSFTYQLLIALMTYLPIEPLYAYKILSCIFDYLLAGAVAYLVYDIVENNKLEKTLLSFIMVSCSPVVLMDSAAWAQCDSIYTFWVVLSIIFLRKEKYIPAFIYYGVGFAFKFQSVFALPFFLFYYFYKRKFSVLHFGLIPVTMTILALPSLVQGRTISEMIHIYTDNTSLHTSISNGFPTFWRLLNDGTGAEGYTFLKYAAMALTVVILGSFMYMWIRNNINLNNVNIILIAFILTYSTITFLPAMHERYGFIFEILAIVIVFIEIKTIPLLIGITCLSLTTYGVYLFNNTVNEWFLAVINFVFYVSYMIILNKNLIKHSSSN